MAAGRNFEYAEEGILHRSKILIAIAAVTKSVGASSLFFPSGAEDCPTDYVFIGEDKEYLYCKERKRRTSVV
jgi:hypothetical protein